MSDAKTGSGEATFWWNYKKNLYGVDATKGENNPMFGKIACGENNPMFEKIIVLKLLLKYRMLDPPPSSTSWSCNLASLQKKNELESRPGGGGKSKTRRSAPH
jgi:hypothetical protein